MGKVLFSQVSVCPHSGRGGLPTLDGGDTLDVWGYLHRMGATYLGWGVPTLDRGTYLEPG